MKRIAMSVLALAALVSLLPWGRFGDAVYAVLALTR